MPASIGEAFGLIKGRKTGNVQEAQDFIDNMGETEFTLRNRNESKLRAVRKSRVKNPMLPK